MKKLESMTKDERSLLLFLETRAVDYGGRVNLQHMNREDFDIAEKWHKEGFISFGRIVHRFINKDGTHSVVFFEDAWRLAHKERIARSKRMWLERDWITTGENIDMYGIAAVRFGVAGK